jgi:hypothetical protein
MSDNKLYNEFERSREAYWAHQEDVKALEAIRRKMDAESAMAANLAAVQQKTGQA